MTRGSQKRSTTWTSYQTINFFHLFWNNRRNASDWFWPHFGQGRCCYFGQAISLSGSGLESLHEGWKTCWDFVEKGRSVQCGIEGRYKGHEGRKEVAIYNYHYIFVLAFKMELELESDLLESTWSFSYVPQKNSPILLGTMLWLCIPNNDSGCNVGTWKLVQALSAIIIYWIERGVLYELSATASGWSFNVSFILSPPMDQKAAARLLRFEFMALFFEPPSWLLGDDLNPEMKRAFFLSAPHIVAIMKKIEETPVIGYEATGGSLTAELTWNLESRKWPLRLPNA